MALDARLWPNRDLRNLSGATLSARAVTESARLALALLHMITSRERARCERDAVTIAAAARATLPPLSLAAEAREVAEQRERAATEAGPAAAWNAHGPGWGRSSGQRLPRLGFRQNESEPVAALRQATAR